MVGIGPPIGEKQNSPKGLDNVSPSGNTIAPMDLKSWLAEKHGRAISLSRFIDVPPSFVSKMASGEKAIPAEHCRAIVDFTEGQVTVQEMRADWYKYWPELASRPANTEQAVINNVAQGA